MARIHRDSLAFTVVAGTSEISRGIIARETNLVAGE